MHFGKRIIGSHGGEAQPELDIPKYAELAKYKDINFDKLISKVYALSEVNDAISDMRTGAIAGRVLIQMWPGQK